MMPAFNAGTFLLTAVQSVLAQTFRSFELIVLDDGSTDNSIGAVAALSDRRLRILQNEKNRGLTYTRNRLIAEASAPLLACLDADDIAEPERLEHQVSAMLRNRSLALLGTGAHFIDHTGRIFSGVDVPTADSDIRSTILLQNKFVQSSVMMRAPVVRKLGGYSPNYPLAEDYALWLRIMDEHEVGNLPARLVQYRIHPGQTTGRKLANMRAMASRASREAWTRWTAGGRSAGVYPPSVNGWRSRLRGRSGTLGADYLHLSNTYIDMGNPGLALKLAIEGLSVAPLGSDHWRAVWRLIRRYPLGK